MTAPPPVLVAGVGETCPQVVVNATLAGVDGAAPLLNTVRFRAVLPPAAKAVPSVDPVVAVKALNVITGGVPAAPSAVTE